jgi:hypothetical protein
MKEGQFKISLLQQVHALRTMLHDLSSEEIAQLLSVTLAIVWHSTKNLTTAKRSHEYLDASFAALMNGIDPDFSAYPTTKRKPTKDEHGRTEANAAD